MGIISAQSLTKVFTRRSNKPGVRESITKIFHLGGYQTVYAVDDISFEIEPGEMVGYVGPNGAGKSTTIKMLSGILVPTRGKAVVDGRVPYIDRVKNAMNISVVFGQRSNLWWDLPVGDSFELIKKIYEIPTNIYRDNIGLFDELLGLKELWAVPVRTLSLGQKMRCELAVAFLHNPKIVYLDEPTIGLDLVAKERIRQLIKWMNREKKMTMVLTTHDLGDIEDLCPRIIIIDHGHVLYDGSTQALKDRFVKHRVIAFDVKSTTDSLPDFEAICLRYPGLKVVRSQDHQLWVQFDKERFSASQVIERVMSETEILDLSIREVPIEEIIKKIYAGSACFEPIP